MLSINDPCPKSWNEMSPVNEGRYCDTCCKVVVDFTNSSNEEIIGYLSSRSGVRVCGKLKREMVFIPKPQNRITKFLAALLVVFSFGLFTSCGDRDNGHVVGEIGQRQDSVTLANMKELLKKDSTEAADSLKKEAPFKLSSDDSARVADSVAKNKNQVRDFN